MKTRNKFRIPTFLLACLLTAAGLPIQPLPASAAERVSISASAPTVIYVSEQSDAHGGNLYREASLGDPYFDGVRPGDWFTIPVSVEKAGDYHFCFSFGWLDSTGSYTVSCGDASVDLNNTVPGRGWRDFVDSSEATIRLEAGEQVIRVDCRTAGPNIRALKLAPIGVDISLRESVDVNLFDQGMAGSATQVRGSYAVQFRTAVPFSTISLLGASWNNNIGSLLFALYPWNSSYDTTRSGDPIDTKEFINFPDNSVLRMEADGTYPAGEYLLYIINTSDSASEEVGFWSLSGTSARARNFADDTEVASCARITLTCAGGTGSPLLPLSPAQPDAEEIKPTAGDLYPAGNTVTYAMGNTDTYGVQFRAASAFTGCEVYVSAVPAEGGSLTLSLYAWAGNYAKSIAEKPCAGATVTGIRRGSWVTLPGDFKAGEYLLVLSGGSDSLAVEMREARTDRSVTYLHTSASGLSLVSRLTGTDISTEKPSTPDAQDFVSSGAWAATDGLGRTLPDSKTAGGIREGKYVGLFYHTWHASLAKTQGDIVNVSEIVAKYPEAVRDYDHPAWGGVTTCFWNEPLFGYYNNGIDRWVLRKHAELLADAGVDVVFFDNTNGTENFIGAILTLCEVWAEARADGVKTPQISAMLNMYYADQAADQIIELYDRIYAKGLYEDLWFRWEGKPLLLGNPTQLRSKKRTDAQEFFTFRVINPSYTTENDLILPHEGSNGVKFVPDNGHRHNTAWKWISIYPQAKMMRKGTDTVEEMCVSVAQNWSAGKGLTAMNAGDHVFGRGYTHANGPDSSEYAITHGLNFAEQWEYALSVDPTFIYITGWNEWEAGRTREMWGDPNAIPDNALDGFSRDIEPSTGVLKDHFYYQMVSYIRRFKGIPTPDAPSTGIASGAAIDWDSVSPVFRSYAGNTLERNADGYRGYHYENRTGRNDIVESRVTYDRENLYFYVRTASPLSPETDKAWMRLFLDVGESEQSWETFEYIINRQSPENGKATLERFTGGWNFEAAGSLAYAVTEDRLVITVPRAVLGLESDTFTLAFKWSDNAQADGDVMDFYSSGDTAPGGRFKYVFTAAPAQTASETVAADTDSTQAPVTETESETGTSSGGCRSAVPALMPLAAAAACAFLHGKRRRDDTPEV